MVHKTSEIYKTLKALQNKEPEGIKIEDIVYAIEHKRDPNAHQELIGLSPFLLRTLEARSLLSRDQLGFHLTDWGHSILKRYEDDRKKYGSKNVEIIPANVEGKITFNVKANPKTESKNEKEIQMPKTTYEPPNHETPKECIERKEKMFGFLKNLRNGSNFITTAKDDGILIIKTPIHYFRTTEERKRLDEIANETGMEIESSDEGYIREYNLTDRWTTVTLKSIRKGKGFKTYQPLEVKVNLNQPTDSVEKLISSLIERFQR